MTRLARHVVCEPKANNYLGHLPGSGIQAHSVSAEYPLAVVGYGTGDYTNYAVENLETGVVLAMFGGNIKTAYQYAAMVSRQRRAPKTLSDILHAGGHHV